jgi:hypothetical protein
MGDPAAVAIVDRNHGRPVMMPAASERDGYLKLPFAWTSSKRFGHGQTNEYRLDLRANRVAILRLVADKGWAMSIVDGDGETPRGLFATPDDALLVLAAEFAE